MRTTALVVALTLVAFGIFTSATFGYVPAPACDWSHAAAIGSPPPAAAQAAQGLFGDYCLTQVQASFGQPPATYGSTTLYGSTSNVASATLFGSSGSAGSTFMNRGGFMYGSATLFSDRGGFRAFADLSHSSASARPLPETPIPSRHNV